MTKDPGVVRPMSARDAFDEHAELVPQWEKTYDDLRAERDRYRAAIEDYLLWEPGKRGHAEAHRKLLATVSPLTETA